MLCENYLSELQLSLSIIIIPQVWEIIGELGDGAFGKVHKVRHRQRPDGLLAAAKICVLETEDELADFMVEIDILSEVSHENVIKLFEAYFYQDKLWVSQLKRWPGTGRDTWCSLFVPAAASMLRF